MFPIAIQLIQAAGGDVLCKRYSTPNEVPQLLLGHCQIYKVSFAMRVHPNTSRGNARANHRQSVAFLTTPHSALRVRPLRV
jgi:hypothetical protein